MNEYTRIIVDGEPVSYLPVRDFKFIRIVCERATCRAAFELRPDQVEAAMTATKSCCPICGNSFAVHNVDGSAEVVANFAKAVIALGKLTQNVSVELPIQFVFQPK